MATQSLRDTPFERGLRRQRRDRAARQRGIDLFLHRRTSEDLLDRLSLVNRRFDRALIIGCADNWLTERLKGQGVQIIVADPGARFARDCAGVQCDEDFLPFADSSFDLVIAVGTLDSVNDLPGALLLIRKVLRSDGLFLASLSGAGSLPRLRSALRAAEEAEQVPPSPRLHPQIDVRAAGDLLSRAGFALPVVDSDQVEVRYRDLMQLVRDLRAMAATNMLSLRSDKGFSRLGLAAAHADFAANADPDGKTPEHFEVLHLMGWAPAPSQPQPARRGSGAVSLAEVLRKKG